MELFVRATVIYWFLWIVIRGTGKRSLAELTPLDLLLIVILGDFVQQGVTQEDMSMTGAMIAVSVFVLWTLAADYWGRRSRTANRVLASEPVIVTSLRAASATVEWPVPLAFWQSSQAHMNIDLT